MIILRNLMICFNQEGEYFREIDEERHYYLSEAEEIISDIRKRIAQEKRVVSPKPFECWLDGKKMIVTHVFFDKKDSLEKQLEDTIMNFDSWEEQTRYKYVNKLKEYAQEERQLFLNKEFKAFAIRFDQVLGSGENEPFPFLLDVTAQKKIFDGIYTNISTGLYAELEEIMGTIKTSLNPIIKTIHTQKENEMVEMTNAEKNQLIKNEVYDWLAEEKNLISFVQYVSASYKSVPKNRIDSICTKFKPYQSFVKYLFYSVAAVDGYKKAHDIHYSMEREFHETYDKILFEGFVLKNDDMLESLVLSPVIEKYRSDFEKNAQRGLSDSAVTA